VARELAPPIITILPLTAAFCESEGSHQLPLPCPKRVAIVNESVIIFTNVKAGCHRYWKLLARSYDSIPIFSSLSLNCHAMSAVIEAIGSTPTIQDEIPALSVPLFSFVATRKREDVPLIIEA